MEEQKLLVQKYFPNKWEDIELPTNIRNLVTEMQKNPGYRLLMYGSAGTGKTSTARILVSDTSKYETLYLSGSNDFKIDTLRQKVYQFSAGISVTGKHKVVIIDECENIRNDLQDAFKILLDQSKSVSFIFITNEVEKVNLAVQSRCTKINFDFSGEALHEQKKNFVRFIVNVCKSENIEYDKEGVITLFNRIYPDFRHTLVVLQQIKDTKQFLTAETVKNLDTSGKQMNELYELVIDRSLTGKDFYETASKLKGKERECLISLGEPFFEYLNNRQLYDKTIQSAVVVAKYSDMFVVSINKFVTLIACLTELRSLFK